MKKIEKIIERTDFEINNKPILRFIRSIKSLPRAIYSYIKGNNFYQTISGFDKSPEVREKYERYHEELLNQGPTRLE